MYTKRKEDKMKTVKNICLSLKRYSFLLEQLISRDFKVKYKRSVLGVLWSLLNPILMMCVMAIVFTNVFKFSTPGVNYLTYLLTGLVFFNYFNEASNLSMSSVVANFSLINKIYIPKYIFPLSKCLFVGINFLLTLIPLYAVIILTGTGLNIYHFLLPLSFIFLFVFTLGVSLFPCDSFSISDGYVLYFMELLYRFLSYMTPIMYDINMLDPRLQMVLKLNPLYHIITFARTIILYHQIPTSMDFAACIISSIASLIIGAVVFRKNQDKFIYYV